MEDYAIDMLVQDIIAGAVATGGDVDVADWVQDLMLLGSMAKAGGK
jgi:hypothetical protein